MTLDSINAFTVTVTPQSVLWKYTFKIHWWIENCLIVVYTWFYIQLIVIKVQEGNVIWHKTLRKLKFHPIPAFMKTYTNFKKYFWLGFFG